MRQLAAVLGLTLALSVALSGAADAVSIERTYPVGHEPFGVTIDPTDGRIYVANSDTGSSNPGVLSVVVPTSPPCTPTSCGVTSIALGSPPVMSVLDSGLRKLFVTTANRTLTVVDVATQTVVQSIPNAGSLGIAIDEPTHRVYAASQTSLSMVDGETGTVLHTASAGVDDDWWGVALDASAHRVYVTNLDSYAPSLIVRGSDDLSLIGEVPLPERPRLALAVDVERQLVYVGGYAYHGYLYVVDANSLQITNTVDLAAGPTFPLSATLVPSQDRLYLSHASPFGNNSIVVLDLATLQRVQQVTLPWEPGATALHPDGRLYVAGYSVDLLAAVNLTNSAPVIDSVTLSPTQPTKNDVLWTIVTAHDPDGDWLTYSYQWLLNGVTMIDATGPSLDLRVAGHGERGDTITVRVTATDPQGLVAKAPSVSVVVANARPGLTVVLSSATPRPSDVLTASAAATDADGDPVSVTYEWLRNGVVVPGVTTASFDLAAHAAPGDSIVARVTASDGQGGVQVVSKTALVLPSTGSFLYLDSQPGDWVGRGLQQLFIAPNPSFQAWLAPGGDTFRADIGGAKWNVVMSAPIGVPLAVGTYTGAVRSSFRPAGKPGLDVSGDSHGCNTLTGQFTITEIAHSQYDEIMSFDATFEQHCEGGVPALFGRIHIDIPPPTPGVTLPAGAIPVPTSGSFLYMNSQGDYVGQGREHLYTQFDSAVHGDLPIGGSWFSANVTPPNSVAWWSVNIVAPSGGALALGSYIRAARAPFPPAGAPGLSVDGDGRGCNTVNGKFDVDELSYSPRGDLLVFQATFEQHCEGNPSPLFGRIRIENPTWSPGVTLPSGSITVPTSGTFLYLNSEPGEFVGAGLEQLFTSGNSSVTWSFSDSGDFFRGSVVQSTNTWNVDIAAPPGQALTAGSYVKAVRAASRSVGPGLEIRGDGRSCGVIMGKFDVDERSFWPNGELRAFQATFEQQCFGKALFGRFRVEIPAPVELTVTMRADGSVNNKSGVATVSGTLACSRAASVDLYVTVTQVQGKNVTVTGTVIARINCTGSPITWSEAVPADSGAFKAGSATAMWNANVCESGRPCVSAPGTRTVKLSVAK
jgi:DNA-binding beta-propeller fold protein YncE